MVVVTVLKRKTVRFANEVSTRRLSKPNSKYYTLTGVFNLYIEEKRASIGAATPLAGAGQLGAGAAAAGGPRPEHHRPPQLEEGGGEAGQLPHPPPHAVPGGAQVVPAQPRYSPE